jgi:hypothetical protein
VRQEGPYQGDYRLIEIKMIRSDPGSTERSFWQ